MAEVCERTDTEPKSLLIFVVFVSGQPDMTRNMFGHEFMTGDEMEALFEREKFAYLEKSKYLQDQLETFKSDIEDLKRDDKISELDKIHRQQKDQGENKYSTIQKVTIVCP